MSEFLPLGILLLALVCFVGEWFPPDVTAIGVTIALLLTGLVTPEEGLSGFGSPATITVMAMFVLSAGIARTGSVQVVGNMLRKCGGKNVPRQILSMGAIVGPITALINNTAVVAVFLPVVEEWCRKLCIPPSKLLMPLSFVTILGGMITTVGTSTNVLASGISAQLGYGEFDLFEFTPLGIATFIIGLGFLAFIGPLLLPERESPNSEKVGQTYGLKDYVSEVIVSPNSPLVGETLRSTQLQHDFDIDVLELIRGENRFPVPIADKPLLVGDILLVRGEREELLTLKSQQRIDILPDVRFGKALADTLQSEEESVAEALVLSGSEVIGSTLEELRFRQRYNVTVLAIRRGPETVRERLGSVPLKQSDLLLLQGPKESLVGIQLGRNFLLFEQQKIELARRNKAWIAIAIILGVVAVAALNWFPIVVTALVGVLLMVITGCLKPVEIYQAVRWDIIFLLAGLIPLGIALEKSGTNQLLANFLLSFSHGLSGYWILLFFFVATSLLTEVLSNNASVVLLLPIAARVAEMLNLNPFAFILAVVFAASNSFMTPIGYQTNAMVYGPGGYRFLDFVRVGGMLNVLMAVITPALIVLIYGL
jgi:di/tricarboxylate transporter